MMDIGHMNCLLFDTRDVKTVFYKTGNHFVETCCLLVIRYVTSCIIWLQVVKGERLPAK